MRRLVLLLVTASSSASPASAAQAPATRISFMVFGDTAEKAAYERLVADFTRQQPGRSRCRSSTSRARATTASASASTSPPARRPTSCSSTTAATPPSPPGACSSRSGPTSSAARVIKEGDFYPQAMEPFRWQGTLMCIPQNLSSLVVYYNRDLFERAGVPRPTDDWTWDDFLHAARALTRDTRGSGRIDQYGLGTEVSIFRLAPFVWQNGGELVDDPKAPTRLTLDAPLAREAVQWFVDLQMKHHVVPDLVEEKAESSERRFLNGRLGMFLNSRRGVPTYRTITSFDWDVAPLPRRRQRAGILHADAYCMPKAGQRQGRRVGVRRVRQLARGAAEHRRLRTHGALAARRWPSRRRSSIPAPGRRAAACSSPRSRSSGPCR